MLMINRSKIIPSFEGYKLSKQSIVDSEHVNAELIPNSNTLRLSSVTSQHQHPLAFKQYRQLALHNHLHKFLSSRDNTELLFVTNNDLQIHVFIVGNVYQFWDKPIFTFPGRHDHGDDEVMKSNVSLFLTPYSNVDNQHQIFLCSDGMGRLYLNSFVFLDQDVLNIRCEQLQMEQQHSPHNSNVFDERSFLFEYVQRNRSFSGSEQLFNSNYLPSVILSAFHNHETQHLTVVLKSSLDYSRGIQKTTSTSSQKRVEFFISVVKFKLSFSTSCYSYRFDSIDIFYSNDDVKSCFFVENGQKLIVTSSSTILKHQDDQSMTDTDEEPIPTISSNDEQQDDLSSNSRSLDRYTSTLDVDPAIESDQPEECHICAIDLSSMNITYIYSTEVKPIVVAQDDMIGIPHDVDICIFKYNSSENSSTVSTHEWPHSFTLHAFHYILNGKPNKKFVQFSPGLALVTERNRIYLYNHVRVDQRTHQAPHQIVELEEDEELLGIKLCGNGVLAVLTQDNIIVYPPH